MKYFLSKLFPLFFYPLGIAVTINIAGLLFLIYGRGDYSLCFLSSSLIILYVFSLPITAHYFIKSLEKRYYPPKDLPSASTIILLGGGLKPSLPPRIHIELDFAGDRVLHAARIFHRGLADFIIASGGKKVFTEQYDTSEGEDMATVLIELFNIQKDAILIEDKSFNTHDQVKNIKILCEKHNLSKTVLLVTSAMHMFRSKLVFEKRGFTVYPAPIDYWTESTFHWNISSFIPNAKSLFRSTMALHEYYGIFIYKVLKWI